MKKLTSWIVSKCIIEHQNINNIDVRTRYGMLEGVVSIVGNTLLFIVKIIAGISVNSIALIADAVHTLADSVTSMVIVIGFKMAGRPSDKEHPFGHGRMEAVAALVVSVLLFVAGIELIEKAVGNILHPPQVTPASFNLIMLISVTLVFKEIMARFSYALGDMIDSGAIRADALHHRTDSIATGLVIIALVFSRYGYDRIDGIMGIFVSGIIFYAAYLTAKDAINPLIGEAPSEKILKQIETIAITQPSVKGVHDIIVHKYGSTNIISLHIEVAGTESAFELHDIAQRIEDKIDFEIGGMVIVHIDPINNDHPLYDSAIQAVKEIVIKDERIKSFHGLRIFGGDSDKLWMAFDIDLFETTAEEKKKDIQYSIRTGLENQFPDVKVRIHVDPSYTYNP